MCQFCFYKNRYINDSNEFQLENSEQKVQALIDSNDDMRSEITRLATIVNKLVNENLHLKGGNGHETFRLVKVAVLKTKFTPFFVAMGNEVSPTHSAISNNVTNSRHSGSNSSLAGLTQNQITADMYARASPGI